MSNPRDHTVGWISAIDVEHLAARHHLDVEHPRPSRVSQHDNNDYTLGRIGDHNVVIAVLPDGEYGTSTAAAVARDMMHTFPNIRIGLMVGIGGGAFSKSHDIRLGDVVVSAPRDRHSGVVQYDFGKTVQLGAFQPTRVLDQPPMLLRTAMRGLRTHYESDGHNYEASLAKILERKPRLRSKYGRPDPSSDRLYKPHVIHRVSDDCGCESTCGANPSNLIQRHERGEFEDNPAIDYGLIASGSKLMSDALLRDAIIDSEGILCFEMEAAGLMKHFPCLVIRGIGDYVDSHKNKTWQGYAAMVAAAYASDLLRCIAPNEVEAETRIWEDISEIAKLMKGHRITMEEQLQGQKNAETKRLEGEERECHQLFRLANDSKDVSYEWYKDLVDERIDDTCLWFLGHHDFQAWTDQPSGLMLVSADPGCGKSVLAKYVIDHVLPRSKIICYFFFKEEDQNTVRQALCAVLHQLFQQKPCLIKHAMAQYHKDGKNIINTLRSLWHVLKTATEDPECGPCIIVLDALDECHTSELRDLMLNLGDHPDNGEASHGSLKCLLMSRPYEPIVRMVGNISRVRSQTVHSPGEHESDTISQEVNNFIGYRVKRLAEERNLSLRVASHIRERLHKCEHRTYLWVSLVFAYLEEESFKKTTAGFDAAIATLPQSANEAYDHILSKSKDTSLLQKALCLILGASRPLETSEMNIAVNVEATTASFEDIDLEDDIDFKSTLRSWCGLFVSIHHNKVYLLHQTAREFLLADLSSPSLDDAALRWHRSISLKQAHNVLSDVCVRYLKFLDTDIRLSESDVSDSDEDLRFLDYAANNWAAHFRKAEIDTEATLFHMGLDLYQCESRAYSICFKIYMEDYREYRGDLPKDSTGVLLSAHLGHESIVQCFVNGHVDVNFVDHMRGSTPLSWAARNGYQGVAEILLRGGANVNMADHHGETPLWWAVFRGDLSLTQFLIGKGADVNQSDSDGASPLASAATHGNDTLVRLLLEPDAKANTSDKNNQTPLWRVFLDRDRDRTSTFSICKLLLESGAEVNAMDAVRNRTPLWFASRRGHTAVVDLLLRHGANANWVDKQRNTSPLMWAAGGGHLAIVRKLLDAGAEVNGQSKPWGESSLMRAIDGNHPLVVRELLERAADVNLLNKLNRTALSRHHWHFR